jgi:hypothetical protein
MQLDLPITTIDGKPITQEIAAEIVLIDTGEISKCEPITWGDSRGYPAADIDDRSTARFPASYGCIGQKRCTGS